MTLVVHVAAHPDQLVGMLGDRLLDVGEDPFARQVVAVPTRGIERWLTQRLAVEVGARGAGDGICANVDFPSPGALVWKSVRAVPELADAAEAWEGPALAAHVVEAVDDHLGEPWLQVLARHLDGPESGNRWAAAAKIARLFSGYARRRPEMIRAWAEGADVGPDGSELTEGNAWQAELWRVVRAGIAAPALPELLPDGLEPIRQGAIALDLPDQISVYGLTATDPLDLDVLEALAERRRVDLYLLHPSPALWRTTNDRVTLHVPPPRRALDPTVDTALHPMLRSWAQDSRELQQVLAVRGITADPGAAPPRPGTLLGTLQDDILHNRAPTAVAGPDRSIQIHVCHGARRQVEVMRDAVLHVLAADETLQPRDVVIMTPDLATFAPLIEAAFPSSGFSTDHEGIPDLRVRIADRSPAVTNPLVRFAATVLDLADGRLEATAVRELVARQVVQRRFGFDATTAGEIDMIIGDTRVAWGVDADDRDSWGAGRDETRTWKRGLDRALTGVFYADSAVRVVGDTVPLDGVEGQDARPVGLLAALIDRIGAIRDLFAAPLPVSQWATAVDAAVRMLAAPAWDQEWQWDQLQRLLAEAFPAARGADPVLDVAEARRVLARWVDDRPSPLHFRTGDVTVCTLMPMRSVPYRVVCLLGMDDRRFPRGSRGDGDDLLWTDEVVGDHDRGAEDRQLLLDALMAAGDVLIVTYAGRDELTNDEYPPAVPISELHDVLTDMLGDDEAVVTRHPLQSFSERNFSADELGMPGPWGFDPMSLAGAETLQSRPGAQAPAAPVWPPVDEEGPILLGDLVKFLQHPTRRFLATRVGLWVPELGDTPDDNLPADLRGLDEWGVTDRLLSGLLAGHAIERLRRRERLTDALPSGRLGEDDLAAAEAAATELWTAARTREYDPGADRPLTGMVTAGDATSRVR